MSFSKYLINWYLSHKRDLPWRATQDPYKIWLSEIMLQQTRVEQGLPYYYKFLNAFPTVNYLANASQDEVLKLWQGLGYYSRARNLHETAKFVSKDLNGNFPSNYKGLLALKGVGDYTASAIASFCYNEPVAVVDGNVYRVLSRYFGIVTPINSSEGIKEFKQLAVEMLDKQNPAIHNQAIMEFGALHCKPKNPLCDTCPLADSCVALRDNLVSLIPVKLKKTKVKIRHFNYLVPISLNNETYLEQREGKGIWNGLYQFPLIETNSIADENHILNSIKSHTLFANNNFEIILYNESPIIHKLSHQHLVTSFWFVKLTEESIEGVKLKEINKYPVPVLIENFLNDSNLEELTYAHF